MYISQIWEMFLQICPKLLNLQVCQRNLFPAIIHFYNRPGTSVIAKLIPSITPIQIKIPSTLPTMIGMVDLSLVFSFLTFSFMMCFFTLLIVNQNMTYFEKYQDVWDVMVTVKNTDIDAFTETGSRGNSR